MYLNEAGQTPTLILENTKARHVGARTDCLPEITSFARTSLCKANRRKRRWMAPFMAREVVTKTDPSIAFHVSDSLSLTLLRPFSRFEGQFNSIFPRKMALVVSQSSLDLNSVLKVIKINVSGKYKAYRMKEKGKPLSPFMGRSAHTSQGAWDCPLRVGLSLSSSCPGYQPHLTQRRSLT